MTAPPPAAEQRAGLSPGAKVLLFVGLPLLALAIIVAVILVALSLFRASPVNANEAADAGSSVTVTVPNANLSFTPSDDDQVHVTMTGRYAGQKPTIEARTTGDETRITGGCPSGWNFLARCEVSVVVSLPEDLDLTAEGMNGRLRADGLSGDLDLGTTNGRIETSRTAGRLDLHTTNGAIEVRGARSGDVRAETTNGGIELTFADAPDTVTARSTNGGITIRVPDDGEDYFIEADTTNGDINTDAVPSDRRADREITAETTNGGVTVERTGG
jgi:Putative adhesin